MSVSVLDRAGSLHAKAGSVADHLRSPLLLFLRLYFGWMFCSGGWGKLHNLDAVADNFAKWGIPEPRINAMAAGTVECVGGALLVLGLGSRFVAFALTFTMCVAMMTAHRAAVVHFFDDPGNLVDQAAFPFLVAAAVVLAFGPGTFSADALLARRGAGTSRNK